MSDHAHEVSFDRIATLLRERGLTASYVEQTGGGTATIYIGRDEAEFDTDWEGIVGIGPGWFEGRGWTDGRGCTDNESLTAGNEVENITFTIEDTEESIAEKAHALYDQIKKGQLEVNS